ncbi:cytochrome P450 3A31 [Trichonephila clavipes]|nr:cytochrome P450 3A31 [Trichonephila clavipes]
MFGTELFTGPLFITFSLGITSFLFLFWYYSRSFDYWKKRGIPCVDAVPFFGSTYSMLWKPAHEIELERHLKYGPLYGHFEGNRPVLSVGDLKLIREVLVKEFPSFSNRRETHSGNVVVDSILPTLRGEDWKRVRSIVSPTFTTGKIRREVVFAALSMTPSPSTPRSEITELCFESKEFQISPPEHNSVCAT